MGAKYAPDTARKQPQKPCPRTATPFYSTRFRLSWQIERTVEIQLAIRRVR